VKEIVTMGYAPGNILDTTVFYSDSSNWVMVFDHTLQLMFPPVECKGHTGGTFSLGYPNTSGYQDIYVFWSHMASQGPELQIFRIGSSGEKKWVKTVREIEGNPWVDKRFLLKMKEDYNCGDSNSDILKSEH
jgi:hypothetical protein